MTEELVISFPTSIPSYAGFTGGHTLQADNHASQHNAEQTDITALGTKVGTGSATSANNQVLRGNGTGTSTWDQVHAATDITGILPTSLGGTGTTNTTGTGSVVFGTSPTLGTPTITSPTISGTVAGSATYSTPTLSTPVIANFSSATHNHQNNAGGGLLDLSAVDTTAWVSWTPSLTNMSVGTGSITAKYRQVGKVVQMRLRVAFSTGMSVGSGPTLSFPVTAHAQYTDTTEMPIGVWVGLRQGVAYYTGYTHSFSTTTFKPIANAVSGSFITKNDITNTVPATWAASDEWYFSATYEAA